MKFKPTHPKQQKGAGMLLAGLLMVILLILPVMALHRLGLDLRWVGTYGLILSGLTYWAYAHDKRQAQEGEWRTPEAKLHALELLGGWPGALMAQRRLRHKCSKGSYQFVFWLIILAYQFAAFDSLRDGQLSRAGLRWIQRTSGNRK